MTEAMFIFIMGGFAGSFVMIALTIIFEDMMIALPILFEELAEKKKRREKAKRRIL